MVRALFINSSIHIGTKPIRLLHVLTHSQQNCESCDSYDNGAAARERIGAEIDAALPRVRRESVAFARCFGEEFLELAFHAFEIIGIGGRIFLAGDIGPFG